jgi:Flp pilus assembly protein CpaB
VVLGAFLVSVSALAGAILVESLTETVPVLAAAADLDPGQIITEQDLQVIELSELGAAPTVAVGEQATVLGLAARGPIPAGTILNPGLFIDASRSVPAGRAVVGAALDPGAAAGSGLRSGDRVDVLGTRPAAAGSDTDGATATAQVLTSGTVWAVEQPDAGSAGRIVVTLLVPLEDRAPVVQAAADDRLRLARIPG